MRRRSGLTLVEVLVAIFVMGIGMIALLTLFPIGVLRMAQAINAERAVQAAQNAHTNSLIYNIRNDPTVIGAPAADFFVNPGIPATALKSADPFGESYVILVDPIGSGSGTPSPWVGGPAYPNILRRRPTSFATGAPATAATMYGTFTLWDDMAYNNDPAVGFPGTPEYAGLSVMRNSRFSWAYTMRRPVSSDRSIVEASIIVFDSRSTSLNSNLNLGEYVYNQTAYFNPTANTVTIDYTGGQGPPLRPGNWLMDATVYTTTNAAGLQVGSQHGYWYRVLSAQDVTIGVNTYAVYEIQGQIRGFSNFPTAAVADPANVSSNAYQGTVVVLDGVAEVFEKGPVRTP